MRPPKNFDNKMNRRKQLLPEVPQATAADVGKIVKVSDSGAYELGEDENTIIIPNPDTTPSATLNALTIGSTTYKVNDARVTKILGLRFTIDNGGTYNANLPQISIVNEYGEAAVLPTNTMTCDKPVQYGALTPTGTPGVLNENLPAKITLAFAAEFNIEDYPNIKLTKGGLFPQDIAKNIKIEYTINDDEWVEIADLVSIDWTGDSHVYDMSTGEETETTPAIPTPTIADAGKFLGVDNNGAWELGTLPETPIKVINATLSGTTITFDRPISDICNDINNSEVPVFINAKNSMGTSWTFSRSYYDSYDNSNYFAGMFAQTSTFTIMRFIIKNSLSGSSITAQIDNVNF